MRAHPRSDPRKTYSTPTLRSYGSVVAVTRGSRNNGNDGGGSQTKN